MEIDLTKVKPGYRIDLLGGSSVEVVKMNRVSDSVLVTLTVKTSSGFTTEATWYLNGKCSMFDETLLDIIAVHPPEFFWKDAKPGMAFLMDADHAGSRAVVWFMEELRDEVKVVKNYYFIKKKDLTRAPAHDLPRTT